MIQHLISAQEWQQQILQQPLLWRDRASEDVVLQPRDALRLGLHEYSE